MELKNDKYKNRLELIPTELIEEVGRVLTFGANKYAPNAWRKAKEEDYGRFVGAAMRHLEAYRKGEYFDPESGLPHLAHAATNLGFLLALDKKNKHYAGADIAKSSDVFVSEDEVNKLCSKLAAHIRTYSFDRVVLHYIPASGKYVADKLAEALTIQGVKRVDIVAIGQDYLVDVHGITQRFIVDDIVDTGNTLRKYMPATVQYPILSLFKRYNADTKNFDVRAAREIMTDDYITFYWEVQDVENK